MKQFFIIFFAILAAAGVIALAVGIYDAKKDNDAFKAKMQQVDEDANKATNSN